MGYRVGAGLGRQEVREVVGTWRRERKRERKMERKRAPAVYQGEKEERKQLAQKVRSPTC